jgi:hypothetical protein
MAVDFRKLFMEEVEAEKKAASKITEAREKALADPSIADEKIASYLREQIPSGAKVKEARYANKTDAVSSFFQGDDPRKDLGDRIKKSYSKLLGSPEYAELSPDEALNIATAVEQERRKTETFEFIRRDNASFLGLKGNAAAAPGYEEWVAGQRGAEDEAIAEREGANLITDAPMNAGIGAAFAGTGLAVTNTATGRRLAQGAAKGANVLAKKIGLNLLGKQAAKGLMAAPHPLAKVAGAAAFATLDLFVAEKAMEMVGDTEWGRANEGTKKKLAADLVVGLASGVGVHKAVTGTAKKAIVTALEKEVLSKQATDVLAKLPTGRNAIDAFKKQRAARVEEIRAKGEVAGKGIRAAFEEEKNKALKESLLADELAAKKLEEEIGVGMAEVTARKAVKDEAAEAAQKALLGKAAKDLTDEEIEQQVAWLGKQVEVKEKKLTQAGIQKRLKEAEAEREKRLASNISKIKEENLPVVEEKVAKGKPASVAAKEVVDEEALVERVASESPAKTIEKAAVEKKVSAKAQAAQVAKLEEHKKKWAEQAQKELEAERVQAATAAEAEAVAAQKKQVILQTLENEEKKARIAAGLEQPKTLVSFSKDNPPPILALKNSKQGPEDFAAYQEAVSKPGVLAAQNDVLRQLNSAEWSAFEKKVNTQLAAEKAKKGLASGELTEKDTVFSETSKVDEVSSTGKRLADLTDDELEAKIAAKLQSRVSVAEDAADDIADVGKGLESEIATLPVKVEGAVAEASPDLAKVKTKDGGTVLKRKAVKDSKLAAFAGLAGAGTLAMLAAEGLAPQEAEAGVTGKVAGFLVEQGKRMLAAEGKAASGEAVLKKLQTEGFVHQTPKDAFTLAPKLKTLSIKPAEAGVKNLERMPLGMDHVLSPRSVEGHYYLDGHGPMIELASRENAVYNDATHAMDRVRNILAEVPGSVDAKATKDIAKTMKPVDDMMMPLVNERGYYTAKVEELKKDLKRYEKQIGKGDKEAVALAEAIKPHLDEAEAALRATDEPFAVATKRWEDTVKGLAEKYSTTRIALAVEDTADHQLYPWLAGKLSHQEQVAVARLKLINREYAARIEEVGMRPMKEQDYIHHAQHPLRDQEAIGKVFDRIGIARDGAAAMSKLHHRSVGSKLMMPDVEYVFGRYLPDVNKRIQYHDFWENSGWRKHMNESMAVKSSPGLQDFWTRLKRSFDAPSNNLSDKIANTYNSIEVFRLLAASPSVAFKHAIKVTATLASHDIGVSSVAMPKAVKYALKNALKEYGPEKLGRKLVFTEEEQAIKAFTRQSSYLETVADLELNRVPTGVFEKLLSKANHNASIFIDTVEQFDRGVSFLASLEMAGKRGMTVDQAVYGVFDTIVKNNFLGGTQNPTWLRNPKVRSFFMFQSTPFKIWERRLNMIMRSGKALNKAQTEMWDQMKGIKAGVKEGEKAFKFELIKNALESEKDHFGTPVTKQLMKEMLILGALVSGASKLGDVDLTSHAYHLPFLKMNEAEPGLVMNPGLSAMYKTWQDKDVEEDEFFFSRLLQNWSRDAGLPSTVVKGMRLGKGDIPEMYQDAKYPALSYMFGAPAVGAGH